MCWSIELHCIGLAVVPEGAPVHSWLGRPLPTGGEWKQVGRTEIEFEDNAWTIMKDFIHMIIIHFYISFGSVISRSSSYIVKLYYLLYWLFLHEAYESPAAIQAKSDQWNFVYWYGRHNLPLAGSLPLCSWTRFQVAWLKTYYKNIICT